MCGLRTPPEEELAKQLHFSGSTPADTAREIILRGREGIGQY